jgi:hypothetical protein
VFCQFHPSLFKQPNNRLTVQTIKFLNSIIFWDITPCSPLSFNRRFGGTYRLHLQGRRNKFSKIQQASRWQAARCSNPTYKVSPYASASICLLLPIPYGQISSHFVLKHPESMFFPQKSDQTSHLYKTERRVLESLYLRES